MPVIIDGTLGVNAAAVTTTNWNPTNLSIPGNATIGDASSDTLTINGASVTFAGTATRIKADFSNDTVANQAFFQTTIANTSTQLRAIPNGNGTQSGLFLYGSSDIDNNSWGAIRTVAGVDVRIQSHTTGTGTLLPITFMTGTTERMRIDTAGNVGIGSASPSSYGKLVIAGNSGSGVTALSVLSGGNAGDYGVVAVGVSNAQKGRLVSDANSGNFRLDTAGTTGAMTFHTGASYTEALRIDSSGNVGIGTASPLSGVGVNLTLSQSLALGVTSTTTGDIISSGGGNSASYNGVAIISNARSLSGSANSAVASWIVDVGGRAADGTTFNINKSDTFSISRKLGAGNFYGSSEFFRIDSTGNIGIGTANPAAKLEAFGVNAGIITHYSGQSRGGLFALTGQRVAYASTASTDDLVFGTTLLGSESTSFTEVMRVKNSNSRVGIGTNSPTYTLHVQGNAGITGGRTYIGNSTSDFMQIGKDSGSNAFIDATLSGAPFGVYVTPSANANGVSRRSLLVDSEGRVTAPYQPGFMVRRSTTITASENSIKWDQIHHNIGSHYNSSTGIFTAPVSGRYLFTMYILALTNGTIIYMYTGSSVHYCNTNMYSTQATGFMNVIVNLSAGDQCWVKMPFGSLNQSNNDNNAWSCTLLN